MEKRIQDLINLGEGYHLELKESFDKSFIEEVCAFANSGGGKIIFGVTDQGKIKGTDTGNSSRSRIQDCVKQLDPNLKINIEIIVGLFLIAGFASFSYLAIKMGEISFFMNELYAVTARFTSISGLKEGAAIELADCRCHLFGSILCGHLPVKKTTKNSSKGLCPVYLTQTAPFTAAKRPPVKSLNTGNNTVNDII